MHRHRYRTKSGRKKSSWRAKVRDQTGRLRYLRAPTRGALREKISALKTETRRAEARQSGEELIADYLPRWLQSIRHDVRPGTWTAYERACRCQLIPHLGYHTTAGLLPSHVDTMVAALLDQGLSRSYVVHARGVLRSAYRPLVVDGAVSRNPASLAGAPKRKRAAKPRHRMQTWSREQVSDFLAFVRGDMDHRIKRRKGEPVVDRSEALYHLALLRGMRQGELLGLRWSRVDFEHRALTIDVSLQRVDGRLQLMPPKSEASNRTIALPSESLRALQRQRELMVRWKLAAGSRWDEHGLVFTTRWGTPLESSYARSRFCRSVERAQRHGFDLPRIRFHEMRHTCATLMLEAGISPKVVQHTLGHASIRITLDLYSHVSDALERGAGDALEAAIFGERGLSGGLSAVGQPNKPL